MIPQARALRLCFGFALTCPNLTPPAQPHTNSAPHVLVLLLPAAGRGSTQDDGDIGSGAANSSGDILDAARGGKRNVGAALGMGMEDDNEKLKNILKQR